MSTLDMSAPVTRGELREELALFDQKLELWGGALLARITESEQRLLTELGRHTRAIQEAMTAQISVIDEKYADLPARVRRLEAKVSALRRR
jgi:flagellar biosynthesis/type III secretory pathway chaperone